MRVSLANHAHVFPKSLNASGTIEELLKYLDACEIDRAVCFAPLPHQDAALDANGWLAGELKSQPRLLGFGTVDFTKPNVAEQVRRIAELGFKGIKIHPPAQKLDIASDAAKKAYAASEAAGLFITFHTGIHHHRIADAPVAYWDEIAWDFPKLRFSMEHVGGWSYFHDALAVIANHVPPPWDQTKCNVFAGLTSIFSAENLPFWFMPMDRLKELVRQAKVSQLIFGLDFPYNDVAATKRGIETIEKLELPATDTAAILGGNLLRELGMMADR